VSTFQTTVSGTIDSNGHFSTLLADTAQICPSPSTWTFTLTFACPTGTPPSGFQTQVAVTGGGGTEDISSQIIAALPTNPCTGGLGAYLPLKGGTLTGATYNTSPTCPIGTPPGVVCPLTAVPNTSYTNSRNGRVSASTLPRFYDNLRQYNDATKPTIPIVGIGTSVSVGATLSNPIITAPVSYFASDLESHLDPAKRKNWQTINMSINGSTIAVFSSVWTALTTYALSGVTVGNAGTGYAVGDVVTVNQVATSAATGAVIVTSIGGGGSVTGIALSPYVNCGVNGAPPTFGLYATASGVATVNGPPSNCSINAQTGVGSGLTVNITSVGWNVKGGIVVIAYGMNDFQMSNFNTNLTYPGAYQDLIAAINTIHNAGADVVIMTSPHPSVVLCGQMAGNTGIYQFFDLNTSFPQNYPTFVAAPVSDTQVIPSVANSTTTTDFLGWGTPITLDTRFLRGNEEQYHSAATQTGSLIIDAEYYWKEAITEEVIATGSMTGAEQALFNQTPVEQCVHPNDLGHAMSYHRAIDDATASLGNETAQGGVNPANVIGYQTINGNATGNSLNDATPPVPAIGVLDIYSPYNDETTTPLRVSVRTGAADGNGSKAEQQALTVDPATGDLITWAASQQGFRWHGPTTYNTAAYFYAPDYGGVVGAMHTTTYSGTFNVGASGTVNIPIAATSGGTARITSFLTGVIPGQTAEVKFYANSTGVCLGVVNTLYGASGPYFSLGTSGLDIVITNVNANTNYQIALDEEQSGDNITGTITCPTSSGLLSWNGDVGLSRGAAGTLYLGNGTAGNSSGTLQLFKVVASYLVSNTIQDTNGITKLSWSPGTNPLITVAGTWAQPGSSAPVASAGTILGSNNGGQVFGLSAASSLTLTFNNSGWASFASCTVTSSVSGNVPYVSAISKTAVTFSFPSSFTGTIYYNCIGT
jgi:hypothetical protein